MSLNLRKMIVGLAVLVVLLGVYVGYTRLVGNTPIRIREVPKPGPNDIAEVPAEGSGKISPTTVVGRISNAQLIHTNAGGVVDRDFGFDNLYHSQGNQWQVTRPYMTMYQSGFECSVTADKGQVQIESDSGRFIPNDAVFSGNVVIHIAPTEPNEMKEAFIYLDDVMFIAEKSLFSTSGPVRFVSRSAQLIGRGMELLYDEQRERLELFSIRQLDSLRLRSEMFSSLSDASAASARPTGDSSAKSSAEVHPPSKTASGIPSQIPYECIFWENVRIVTPQQILRAKDRLSITDILWAGGGTEGPDLAKGEPATSNTKPNAEPNKPESLPYPGNRAMKTMGSNAPALDSLPESLFDVVVTCKGGLVVRPMGTTLPGSAASKKSGNDDASDSEVFDDPLREIIVGYHIDFDASTGNAILTGPVRMMFHVDPNGLAGGARGGRRIPATLDARKEVRFFHASNQAVLDGNCVLTMRETEPNLTTETRLTSPRLTLDLIEDANAARKTTGAGDHALGPAVHLRRATASGGPVALQILQKTAAGLIEGVELRGRQFDYEAQQNRFTVMGPGQISLYNSQGPGAKADSNEFSLRQPCYAFLRDFDSLIYSKAENRITADSKSKQLQVDYFPIDSGRTDRHVQADVGHIEIELAPAADNRMELASLRASEGIVFQDRLNRSDGSTVSQFDGSTLFYDYRKALMTIGGDKNKPCYFNGNPVDEIEMNVKTHQAKAKFIAPGTIHIK